MMGEIVTSRAVAPDLFEDVAAFTEKFQVPRTEAPDHQLSFTLQILKFKHLQEELDEYVQAAECGDMVKAFDALIDLVYVALGAAYLHKFPFNEGWQRVHVANMLKRRAESNEDSKRGSKLDIVKPAGWQPPVLDDLIGASNC